MKIQDLAIIFVIIIFPISLVLSAYSQYQIQTLNTQTVYDSQLTAATHDAIKAYQINAENSSTSELANSKIRDIEASVSTFKNSIMSSFRLNGYTEEELNNYIPALVYTMYDGFYIYSPYENTNYQYEEDGNPAQNNGENIYGLKPYITYSCRYVKGDIDVVITYALDNYIKVQGMIGTEYVNKGGYLVEGIVVNGDEVKYNDVTIQNEQLKEYLPIPIAGTTTIPSAYPYVKINGTKYYRVDINTNIEGEDSIIYISNGTIMVQCEKTTEPDDDYSKYSKLIDNNNQAKQYYKEAYEFTEWLKSSDLTNLTYANVHDYKYDEEQKKYISGQIWEDNTTPIFNLGTAVNIENELSNFNQHRLAVIRHKIESNLSIAISNYNIYSGSTNDFQMPELKEDEWDYITHNIALISFLQGVPIGGKVYNGYTIVTNSESEEVVLETNIYVLGCNVGDGTYTYHKIGDTSIEDGSVTISTHMDYADNTDYDGDVESAGRLNLDFKRKFITNNNKSYYYYPLQKYDSSYTSVIMQDKVTAYDDIYAYINDEKEDGNMFLAQAFYTALGRERKGKYNSTTIFNIDE